MLFLPELALTLMALIFFVLSLVAPKTDKLHGAAILAAIASFVLSGFALYQEGFLFFDAYKVSFYTQIFKLFICLGSVLVLLVGNGFTGIRKRYRAEYYIFYFLSVLGLVLMVSSVELITLLVALELSSFTTYIMVALRRKGDTSVKEMLHNEAAIKYLLYGVVATGFTLFGMSYIFGLTGSTHLNEIAQALPELMTRPIGVVSLVLLMAAPFYKLALFPVHSWAPDVYEGAATETTAFVATLPKIAATAVLIRFAELAGPHTEGLAMVLCVVTVVSLFYGNFSALAQKDIKRLLAFSGIAHGGFILLGVLLFDTMGYRNAIYYTVAYIFMNIACFGVLCQIKPQDKNLAIKDLTGLYQSNPLLAITLVSSLFALAGIPPFMGFTGKFMLLVGGLKAGYLIPVILAAANTALALYYYLSVVRLTFCTPVEGKEVQTITLPLHSKMLFSFLSLALLYLGVFPGKLLELIDFSLRSL